VRICPGPRTASGCSCSPPTRALTARARRPRQFCRGIADTGLAEVELVIYPREGHGIAERAHLLDFWERARAFFDKHLRG
jgi:hypothetical protein